MRIETSNKKLETTIHVNAVASLIADTQTHDGEIPWHKGEKSDPWDHVESAIGLTIGGYFNEARLAYFWLGERQLKDGSWYTSYQNGKPEDLTKDANMSAYIAVGVYHYFLSTKDIDFLKKMWRSVKAAIDFALGLQADKGHIYWAISPDGKIDRMALLTGSSSVYMSVKCALAISQVLGIKANGWRTRLERLKNAISIKPHLFNIAKSRYSMDWFYPVLCGAISGDFAKKRIKKLWKKFVVPGLGIKCVADRPWVTIAETSELSLTLSAIGNKYLAEIVFSWILDKRFADGTYWCGFTYPRIIQWPEEKMSWTNAAVLMAADAIYGMTPGSRLFSHEFWCENGCFPSLNI